MLELFTCSSSHKERLWTSTATRSSFAVYAIQFAVSVLRSGYRHTGQYKHRINAHRHIRIEWDSNQSP
jgi:hypothetical protein